MWIQSGALRMRGSGRSRRGVELLSAATRRSAHAGCLGMPAGKRVRLGLVLDARPGGSTRLDDLLRQGERHGLVALELHGELAAAARGVPKL